MIDDILFPSAATSEAFDLLLVLVGGGGALAAALFVITYSFFPWRSTSPGRSVMYLLISLFAMFGLGLLNRMLGLDYAGRLLITIVIFVLIVFTVWRLLISLWSHNRVIDLLGKPFSRTTTTTTTTVVKDDGEPETTTVGPTITKAED